MFETKELQKSLFFYLCNMERRAILGPYKAGNTVLRAYLKCYGLGYCNEAPAREKGRKRRNKEERTKQKKEAFPFFLFCNSFSFKITILNLITKC